MKRISIYLIMGLLLVGCSVVPSRFIVTSVGYEPSDVKESFIYTMPQTSLKVAIHYQKEVFIPGPYADYAQRMLGIDGVQKRRSQKYSIEAVEMHAIKEPDPSMYFSLNSLEGEPDYKVLHWAEENGLIIRSKYGIEEDIRAHKTEKKLGGLIYKDVTMEPNMELKEETIYKTIITDTSFVKVPITTEQMEMKTLGKKAEEAAKLILEIRSDRYYVAAGLIDPFPDNFDMKTSLNGLDRLEETYLSLFIGKSFKEEYVKEYYITPSGQLDQEIINLDVFSAEEGLASSGDLSIQLVIEPTGRSASLRNLFPQAPEEAEFNRFYYRIPEVCDARVIHDNKELYIKRISVYQAGALVNQIVKGE